MKKTIAVSLFALAVAAYADPVSPVPTPAQDVAQSPATVRDQPYVCPAIVSGPNSSCARTWDWNDDDDNMGVRLEVISDVDHARHEWALILIERHIGKLLRKPDVLGASLDLDGHQVVADRNSNKLWLWSFDLESGLLYLNHVNSKASRIDRKDRNQFSLASGRVFCLSESGTVAQIRVDAAVLDRVLERYKHEEQRTVLGRTFTSVELRPGWEKEFLATLRKEYPSIQRFIKNPELLAKETDPAVILHDGKPRHSPKTHDDMTNDEAQPDETARSIEAYFKTNGIAPQHLSHGMRLDDAITILGKPTGSRTETRSGKEVVNGRSKLVTTDWVDWCHRASDASVAPVIRARVKDGIIEQLEAGNRFVAIEQRPETASPLMSAPLESAVRCE